MNFVEQIVAAVEVSAKVATQVFMASLAAIVVEHFFPGLFVGLAEWIMPTLRLMAVFASVLIIINIVSAGYNKSKVILTRLTRPLRRRAIIGALLHLEIAEVATLSRGICVFEREIRMKPNIPPVLSLLEKGFIEPYWSGVAYGDGLRDFQISKEAWELLMILEEFHIPDLNTSRNHLTNGGSEAQILAALPAKHPSVILAKSKFSHK